MHPEFQDNIWIQAASYLTQGKWREIVYFADRHFNDEVQRQIYDAYHMARAKEIGLEGVRKLKKP